MYTRTDEYGDRWDDGIGFGYLHNLGTDVWHVATAAGGTRCGVAWRGLVYFDEAITGVPVCRRCARLANLTLTAPDLLAEGRESGGEGS